ncbi:MAG: tRNA lysidine(34) synthetase TilS [bacterium]
MHHDPSRVVLTAARRSSRATGRPLLLAVSGGLDSMVLLSAMVSVARHRVAAVATFDHGTGDAAAAAVDRVCEAAEMAGVRTVVGRNGTPATTGDGREAAWRAARYQFLSESATSLGAMVATAHTEDDQVETVFMRIMRGSGARGLAGLYASGPILRPFLGLRRAVLEDYASEVSLTWVEDPTNLSREFARNRARRDLLPALRRADPSIDAAILSIARRADVLRREVEAFVTRVLRPETVPGDRVVVASRELAGYDRDSLAVLWAAVAGRVGLALDRRGTQRIAEFTSGTPRRGSMPLAGGWCLEAGRESYVLQKTKAPRELEVARLPETGSLDWGGFRFRVSDAPTSSSLWTASIAESVGGVVRAWSAGDRLEPAAGQPRRRVTRYLSEVGVTGSDRTGWPVVVADDEVVWIPGVRRSDAATDRSGRPVRHYVCERIDR